jgi:hypothetical protein
VERYLRCFCTAFLLRLLIMLLRNLRDELLIFDINTDQQRSEEHHSKPLMVRSQFPKAVVVLLSRHIFNSSFMRNSRPQGRTNSPWQATAFLLITSGSQIVNIDPPFSPLFYFVLFYFLSHGIDFNKICILSEHILLHKLRCILWHKFSATR